MVDGRYHAVIRFGVNRMLRCLRAAVRFASVPCSIVMLAM